jgi:flagellar biosynthesis/type III secretory pathway chaperone
MAMRTGTAESLAAWLQDGIEQAGQLLAALEREQRALLNRRANELESAVADKQRFATALECHTREGEALLRAAALPTDRHGFERLLEREGDSHTRGLWQRFERVCTQGRQLNRMNGGLLESGRRFAEQALALLHGEPAPAPAYGPSAGTPAGASRLIATI